MATQSTQAQPAAGPTVQNAAGSVQLAQAAAATGNAAAAPDTEIKVAIPVGQTIARVPVTPGEVIDLPFDGDFQAKLGDQGNLAIKLGDRIVILENYASANQSSGVTINDDKGHPIDVASVIAATDPNLDIQTAAGPAAGPAAGAGSGLFESFRPGAGIGALGELGAIGQTELQYGLISADANITLRALPGVTLDIPGLGAPGTQVDEAGLPTGSAHDGSNSTTGVITITAPDGVSTVVIDGTTISLNDLNGLGNAPKTITTADGTLTLTSWDGSHLGYTYTLDTPTQGDNTSDPISIVVTDTDGNQASGTLDVHIVDDVPTAHNDDQTLGKADYETHTGNVITGAGEDNPAADADVKGADGATVTSVKAEGGDSSVVNSDGSTTIHGQYGTLTINADGSYTYTRDHGTPGGVDDTFNYTLTDGDGDQSSANLTIHIPDATPTVDVPGVGDDDTTVYEAGLPAGSHTGGGATTSGAISFTPGDGPAVVTIGGVQVTGEVGQQIQGQYGVLTITGYNPTTGEIDYKYTLSGTTHNQDGQNNSDNFPVTVTDQDNETASGSLDISIVDDKPIAHDDGQSLGKADYSQHSGNVITGAGDTHPSTGADVKGADSAGEKITAITSDNQGTSQPVGDQATVIQGQYGVLTINADGSYTYTRDKGTPGGIQDVFHYTLTDGDGSSSSAALTITIPDAKPTLTVPCAGGSDTTVYEAGLPSGSHPGNSDTTSGAIHYTPGDGPATVKIDGVAVTGIGQTIEGEHGFLTITGYNSATGEIDYKYTLTENTKNDHGKDTSDNFTVTVTDKDGDPASASLNISIVDDKPVAHDDSLTLGQGDYHAESGNVITAAHEDKSSGADTKGADGASVSSISSVTNNHGQHSSDSTFYNGVLEVDGKYGTLTIQADGTYTYTRNPGTPGGVDDVFHYTLTDGDGSTSSADLTIHIPDAKPTLTVPCEGDNGTTVYEAGLPNGSHAGGSATTSGEIHYTPGDGPAVVTIGGTQITSVGQQITGQYGILTITGINTKTGEIDYSYQLNHNSSGDNTHDDFNIVVTDKDGDHANSTLTIGIVDDTPKAHDDSLTIAKSDFNGHSGNVITATNEDSASGADTKGADGAKVTSITDGNGQSHTVGANGVTTIQGDYGVLQIAADGTYTYTRNPGTPGGVNDVFHYTLTDGDGDKSTANLTIHIGDATPSVHVPVGADAGTSVNEAGLAQYGSHHDDGSATTHGTITYTPGDGPATVTIDGQAVDLSGHAGQTFTGDYGTLTITGVNSSTGEIDYSYTLTHNSSGDNTSDHFDIVVTDKDGETAPATLTIGIVDDQPIAPSGAAEVYEDGLASGHDGSPGIPNAPTGDIGTATTAHITLSGLTFGADRNGTVSFDVNAQPQGLTSDGHNIQYRTENINGQPTLVGYIEYFSQDNNSKTDVDIFTLTIDPANHTADFNLLQPIDHPDTTKEDNLDLGLKYNVTDGDGDTATGTITVTVNDDSPTAGTVTSPTVVEPAQGDNGHSTSYEVDSTNYLNNPNITITAGFIGDHASDTSAIINTNPAKDGTTGLGVSSDVANGQDRYDEINYLGNGAHETDSEYMSVKLTGDKEATSATVNLSELYAGENGVGNETGAYMLYKDGVPVSGWIAFTADDTNGKLELDITGPAGGFDEIRFIATQGTANPNGNNGSDSSDYSVHDVTFNVPDKAPTATIVSGSLPAAFGADGPGSVALTDGPTGLKYNGVAIVNTLENGIMVGMAGDVVVYTLTLIPGDNNSYSYQFDLVHPIDGKQDNASLPFHYTVTDNDGDHAQGTINIVVSDAPSTASATILTNSLDGPITVSDAALLHYDGNGNSHITGTSIKGTDTGSASHSGTNTTYTFAGGASDFTSSSGKMSEGNGKDWGDSTSNPTTLDRSSFKLNGIDTGTLLLSGAISNSSDQDVFKLHLEANETINGVLAGMSGGSFEIVDGSGHVVYDSTKHSNSDTFNVPSDGDYYIVVDGPSNQHGSDSYQLTLNVHSSNPTDGSFHYQGDGGESSVTVNGQSGGTDPGNDQSRVIGADANEILVGDATHHNYLNGGGGDDWIMYHSGDQVDGGSNSHSGSNGDLSGSFLGDVLDISELSGTVDLHSAINSSGSNQITNIETVSMTGGGSQSISLNISDVLNIGTGTFTPTGMQSHDAVKIEGDASDKLTLNNGTGNDHGEWVNITNQISNAPAGHQVYAYDSNGGSFHANDASGYVIVDNDVKVTVHDSHGNTIG